MKKLIPFLILFFLMVSGISWGAAITSNGTGGGETNQTSTWSGGVVPGDGDTVIISDGDTITVPAGVTWIVGASPADDASTPAIANASTTGTGILIINGTLQFRGSIKQANATWIANAGAAIVHDSSAAVGTPSYTWQIGMAANQANAILRLSGTGTGSNRVTVSNYSGSGRFSGFTGGQTVRNAGSYPTGGYAGTCRIEASYTTFTGIGEVGIESFCVRLSSAGQQFSMSNCILDDCTLINFLPSMHGAAIMQFSNTSLINPNGTRAIRLWVQSDITTGVRLFKDCIIEGDIYHLYAKDVTYDHCAFAGTSSVGCITSIGASSNNKFDDCLYYHQNTYGSSALAGEYNRLVSLGAQTTVRDHCRFSGANASDVAIDGAVVENMVDGTAEEFFIVESNPSSLLNVLVKNVLMVPSPSYGAPGALTAAVGSGGSSLSNYRIAVDNNTIAGSGGQAIMVEQTVAGIDVVQSLRNNLLYLSTSGISYIQTESSATLDDDSIVVADYNNSYNTTNDIYQSTDSKYQSTPGTNDISADPGFVDDTRDFLSWGKTIDAGIAAWSEIWTEIRKMNNDSGYNTAYDWSDFYTWVRAGFAPTNAALDGAGYDGSDIGAIAFDIASSSKRKTFCLWCDGLGIEFSNEFDLTRPGLGIW